MSSHKYILKIGKGENARYFYTQAEIDAYRQRTNQQNFNRATKDIKGISNYAKKHGDMGDSVVRKHDAAPAIEQSIKDIKRNNLKRHALKVISYNAKKEMSSIKRNSQNKINSGKDRLNQLIKKYKNNKSRKTINRMKKNSQKYTVESTTLKEKIR